MRQQREREEETRLERERAEVFVHSKVISLPWFATTVHCRTFSNDDNNKNNSECVYVAPQACASGVLRPFIGMPLRGDASWVANMTCNNH